MRDACSVRAIVNLFFRRPVRPTPEALQRIFAKLTPADVHIGVQAYDGASGY